MDGARSNAGTKLGRDKTLPKTVKERAIQKQLRADDQREESVNLGWQERREDKQNGR